MALVQRTVSSNCLGKRTPHFEDESKSWCSNLYYKPKKLNWILNHHEPLIYIQGCQRWQSGECIGIHIEDAVVKQEADNKTCNVKNRQVQDKQCSYNSILNKFIVFYLSLQRGLDRLWERHNINNAARQLSTDHYFAWCHVMLVVVALATAGAGNGKRVVTKVLMIIDSVFIHHNKDNNDLTVPEATSAMQRCSTTTNWWYSNLSPLKNFNQCEYKVIR